MNNWLSEDKYKIILESIPVCCVDIVVHQSNKVLLVKRTRSPSKGEWSILGGRVHKNEKLKEALLRKIKQELGVSDIEIEKQLGAYEYFSKEGNFPNMKTGAHAIGVVFIVSLKNGQEIKLDEQSEEYKWVDKIEDDVQEYAKKILKDSKIF